MSNFRSSHITDISKDMEPVYTYNYILAQKVHTCTLDKKDTFLLYISFADVDHNVHDKMIYNMSIFKKVDFLSLVACAIMKKGLKPSFLIWEMWSFFVGCVDILGKLHTKYQFYYIFSPQTMIFSFQHLDYNHRDLGQMLSLWDWVTSFLRIIYIAYHKQLCNNYKISWGKNHISHFYFFFFVFGFVLFYANFSIHHFKEWFLLKSLWWNRRYSQLIMKHHKKNVLGRCGFE